MSVVAKFWFHLRRFLRSHAGLVAAPLIAWLLWEGRFSLPLGDWPAVSAWAICVGLLIRRGLLGPERESSSTASHRFELGLLLLSSTYPAIQVAGGPQGMLQPLAYLVIAYLVGFNRRHVGLGLAATALVLQAASCRQGQFFDTTTLLTTASFVVAFAAANLVFVQVEDARRRRAYEERLTQAMRAMRDEARDFRLISSALSSGGDRAANEAKLARGAVESIHQSMFFVIDLLKKSLDLQTCVLLWLDNSGRQLCIKELATDSDMVKETPFSARAGALGSVVKNRLLLNLRRPRDGARAIPYYDGPETVGAFVGVPVVEDGHLRGVLCADRRADLPFSESDEELLIQAAQQVLRAIQTERVFTAVERSKYEHERFYHASTMLNGALTLAEVYETAFKAAQQITPFDFGALTLYNPGQRQHTICRVHGQERKRFEGECYRDNAGLVSMVVKNRHFLPAGDTPREREAVVFTRKLKLPRSRSLVVLPLSVKDYAVGTMVFAASGPSQFPKQVREMLGVICNQVAVSIENAKMYKRMEEMATTDGLTSLPNHRTFQSRFAEMLYRAERHQKPVTMVLTDIDKFKSINDTYGHPVGDVVLKRVARVLASAVRKVDIVARYGGEEFAIVLEETDSAGAALLCERIRQQIAQEVMQSEKGAFRVTLSLGVASYPTDGTKQEELIEKADQALYAAKESGRNRTVRYVEMKRAGRRVAG